MHKLMHPDELTEGEWILETLEVKGKIQILKDTIVDKKTLEKVKVAAEPTIKVHKNGVKSDIPISELTDGVRIAQPCVFNGKTIDTNSYEGINSLMKTKISESSKYVNIHRGETTQKIHIHELKEGDKVLDDVYDKYLKIIDKNNLGIDRYQSRL